MTFRVIFLDMDHTLCDTALADTKGLKTFQLSLREDFEEKAADHIGSTYLQVIYGEKKAIPGWSKLNDEPETHYRTRLLHQIMTEEGVDLPEWSRLQGYAERFMEMRIQHFDFYPGAAEMLDRLRARFKLILITNGPLFSQQPKIRKVAMEDHVDKIILGGMLPYEKPHPSIFKLACNTSGCEPHQALHVGDSLATDILGAHNAGIQSVWINPAGTSKALHPQPDYIIGNIIELESLMTKISR